MRRIRNTIDQTTACTIATSLIHSKIDYCSSLLLNLPATQLINLKLILKFIWWIGKLLPVYSQSFFCSAVLTPQHYHWYAATRFALPGG